MMESCDVVVVGSGPAGSIAARVLALQGINTLVLDKRQEIGAPKRCAEGLYLSAMERVGLKPDPAWALRCIEGSVVYSPGGMAFELPNGGIAGYIVERKLLEKHLARDAIRAGARYMVKTLVKGAIVEDGKVVGVRARHMGEDFDVLCKLVIAADGADSRIAKSAGLNTVNPLSDYHSAFQYEMAGLKMTGLDSIHFYFGNEIAPGGYGWIFPKSEDIANVGVVVKGDKLSGARKTKDYLDTFIDCHPEIFMDASPIEINSGGIPINPSIETLVSDGLMVVGDAAHQVNPVDAGGMGHALYAGKIAAEIGAGAIREGDVSRRRLLEYERRWGEAEGPYLRRLKRVQSFMASLTDDDIDLLFDVLDNGDIIDISEGKYDRVLKKLLFKAPRLLPFAKKFLF